jgi:hypothetical protein
MTNPRAKEYANGDQNFTEWLNEIDKFIISRLAISLFDLSDMLLRDSYDAGTTPEEFITYEIIPEIQQEYGEDTANLLLD